ncbi:hypothetical protein [Edaphobacter modestus]|uniref:Glycerophosphoryl diester phosphodiesterase family protein n=1 Tax=Edaphobacter modestus TaxID=388466 RepID=A0A4Q7YUD3_9BACT|nr:hypothetical protein [Edaphobacter modestus]RZU40579.1 hypothetical protein BDD14_2048 [Edaphobacter modestus]
MPRTRNIFFHGLGIALRRFPAFLWTYVFNLGLAVAFCFPLYTQLSKLLDDSLASQRLSSGFDVSVLVTAATRLHGDHTGNAIAMTSNGSLVAYLLLYFFLVPGTLFSYVTRTPAGISNLLRQGMLHFWRFVRITVVALIAALVILGPLFALQRRWAAFVDDRFVGRTSLFLTLGGLLIVLLVASLLRLYFDLVEVYTVQLGTHQRLSGRPDRRVRRTFRPAFRLLRTHLVRTWIIFLLLALLGAAFSFFATRTAIHMLAQSQVWPMFLVAQLGLFAMLFTRFWQRGVEASLVLQNPIMPEDSPVLEPEGYPYTRSAPKVAAVTPPAAAANPDRPHHVEMIYNSDPLVSVYPAPFSPDDPLSSPPLAELLTPADPIPNPEPASPSLDEPDPGVFHHEPGKSRDHRDEPSPDVPGAPSGKPPHE